MFVIHNMFTDTQYVMVNQALDTGMGADVADAQAYIQGPGELPEMINKCSSP